MFFRTTPHGRSPVPHLTTQALQQPTQELGGATGLAGHIYADPLNPQSTTPIDRQILYGSPISRVWENMRWGGDVILRESNTLLLRESNMRESARGGRSL